MKRSSEDIRRKIIGLGDSSVKKSYYPQLQQKIKELEDKQQQLMGLVRSLEEREEELETLLDEKNDLLSEINHRVKNNLQIVSSLLSLGASGDDSSEHEKFGKAVRRIDALSLVYQQFLFSDNYTEVMFCAFLRAVSMEIKSEEKAPGLKISFDFPVNEIILDIDTAIPLALISFEAISSACCFWAGKEGGELLVSLFPSDADGGKLYRLRIVSEKPAGTACDKGERGFSLSLIEALSFQLSGEYSIVNTDSEYSFSLDFS